MQLALLAGTLAWTAVWVGLTYTTSRTAAVVGALFITVGYALVLGIEFVVAAVVNRHDVVERAGPVALLGAWWEEVQQAPRVFFGRQPFLWRRLPDSSVAPAPNKTAVVLVHGFVCNRGFWLPWMREMRQRGLPYSSVNLEPVFGSIDDYVPLIDQAVRRAHALTGRPPMLVCHSMGGLAARAWRVATPDADARVAHVVTIGTPHRGTWLARFSHLTNGRQMRQNGDWLRALEQRENQSMPEGAFDRFTCWYSNADNIVFPASTATLAGADNRHVPGVAHVALAFQPTVINATLGLLQRLG
jgi:pimeloyl-ACP methyl ester carboxylesterase